MFTLKEEHKNVAERLLSVDCMVSHRGAEQLAPRPSCVANVAPIGSLRAANLAVTNLIGGERQEGSSNRLQGFAPLYKHFLLALYSGNVPASRPARV